MAIALVQKSVVASNAAASTLTAVFPSSGVATAGNFLIAFHKIGNTTTLPSAPAGWSVGYLTSTTNRISSVYWRTAVGGETGITVTTGATSDLCRLAVMEYSGIIAPVLDAYSSLDNGTGTVSTLAATTTPATSAANTIAFAFFDLSAGSGGTNPSYSGTNAYDFSAGYNAPEHFGVGVKILTSTSLGETTTATWTTARQAVAIVAVFKSGVVNATVTPATVNATATVKAPTVTTIATPPSGPATLLEAFSYLPAVGSGVPLTSVAQGAPRFIVQAFDPYLDNAGVWDVSTFDTTYWSGPGQWQDISHRVRGLTWQQGAASPLDRPAVGTATITLANLDGECSPWSTQPGEFSSPSNIAGASPFAVATAPETTSWLQPGCMVRFGVMWTNPGSTDEFHRSWLPFMIGTIESLNSQTSENTDAWVDLSIVETWTTLTTFNGFAQNPQGEGDTLQQRIDRLLNDANYPAGDYVFSDPIGDFATFQATTLADNRNTELLLTVDSVGMRVLCNGFGQMWVTPQQPGPFTITSTVFSNKPTYGQMPVIAVQPYASTDRIVNCAAYARAGSTEQVFQDDQSVSQFGMFCVTRDDLIVESDATVQQVAEQVVDLHAWDSIGVESITLDMDMEPIFMPLQMAEYASSGLTVRTPFALSWTHPSGQVFNTLLLLEGFSQSLTWEGNQAKWTATYSTSRRSTQRTQGTWGVSIWDAGDVWGYLGH